MHRNCFQSTNELVRNALECALCIQLRNEFSSSTPQSTTGTFNNVKYSQAVELALAARTKPKKKKIWSANDGLAIHSPAILFTNCWWSAIKINKTVSFHSVVFIISSIFFFFFFFSSSHFHLNQTLLNIHVPCAIVHSPSLIWENG